MADIAAWIENGDWSRKRTRNAAERRAQPADERDEGVHAGAAPSGANMPMSILMPRFRSLETKVGDTKVSDSLAAALPAASRAYELSREREQIKEAIFSLDPDYRSVIFLRYIEGVKLEDISYILNIPLGTVKSWVRGALKFLREEIGPAVTV